MGAAEEALDLGPDTIERSWIEHAHGLGAADLEQEFSSGPCGRESRSPGDETKRSRWSHMQRVRRGVDAGAPRRGSPRGGGIRRIALHVLKPQPWSGTLRCGGLVFLRRQPLRGVSGGIEADGTAPALYSTCEAGSASLARSAQRKQRRGSRGVAHQRRLAEARVRTFPRADRAGSFQLQAWAAAAVRRARRARPIGTAAGRTPSGTAARAGGGHEIEQRAPVEP